MKKIQWNDSRKELVDSLYLILMQGINQLLPLIVMPYLMVVLGAGGYGYIGFSLSVVQYLTLIVDFGFNLSATKHVAIVKDDIEERSKVFWSVFWAKSLLLLASSLLLVILIAFVPTFQRYGFVIICTFPMVLGSTYTFLWMFQGIGKVRDMAIINTLSKILMLPLIFVFVKDKTDFPMAALLQSMVFVLTAIISSAYLYKIKVIRFFKVKRERIWEEIKDSFPLFLSSASTSVYTQLFVVVLGFLCAEDVVGKYSSAERIMRALCFVLYVPINQAFFPKVSALSSNNRTEGIKVLQRVKWLVLGIMSTVSILLFIFAPTIGHLLGKDYEGFDTLLRIFAFAPIFIGIGGVYGQIGLIALGNKLSRIHFRNVYFVVALLAILFIGILSPLWYEKGTAIALLLTEASVFFLMMYNCKKDIGVC